MSDNEHLVKRFSPLDSNRNITDIAITNERLYIQGYIYHNRMKYKGTTILNLNSIYGVKKLTTVIYIYLIAAIFFTLLAIFQYLYLIPKDLIIPLIYIVVAISFAGAFIKSIKNFITILYSGGNVQFDCTNIKESDIDTFIRILLTQKQ